MIPEGFIDQVRERIDIVAIVDEQVALRKSGTNHFGLCPFHGERTPSFTVNAARGRYHCFGCGADGDAIEFVRATQQLDFAEAVETLAARVGLSMPERSKPDAASKRREEEGARLLSLIARAHERYQEALQTILQDSAHPVAAYCESRGISADVARRHGLGWAHPQALDDWMRSDRQDCLRSGLATQSGDPPNTRVHARMRSRLVFPIRDDKGRVLAFGGRVVPGESAPGPRAAEARAPAKYLNTSETELYRKGEVLYRLFDARSSIVRKKRVLVVEGYMDAIALSEAGIDEAVACCGTALTEVQLAKLIKLAETVIFVFDGDSAGQRAALSAARLAVAQYREDRRFRFLTLPNQLDPDDYIRERGAQAFEQALEGAPALSDFVLNVHAERNRGLAGVEDRAAYLKQLKEFVAVMGPDASFARLLMKEAYRRVYSPKRDGRVTKSPPLGRTPAGISYSKDHSFAARGAGLHSQGRPHPLQGRTEFQAPARQAQSRDFWRELLNAIELAPRAAREQAAVLEELLNVDDLAERKVILALRRAQGGAIDGDKADQTVAADLLRAAAKLITKRRLDAALDALKTVRDQGGMTEEEYLRSTMILLDSAK